MAKVQSFKMFRVLVNGKGIKVKRTLQEAMEYLHKAFNITPEDWKEKGSIDRNKHIYEDSAKGLYIEVIDVTL